VTSDADGFLFSVAAYFAICADRTLAIDSFADTQAALNAVAISVSTDILT
jgi:hypothetical protein